LHGKPVLGNLSSEYVRQTLVPADRKAIPMEEKTTVDELQARLANLEQRLASLTSRTEMEMSADQPVLERRQLLRKVGKVVVGGVAGAAILRPQTAAAADGGNLIIGQVNTATTSTRIVAGADIPGNAANALTVIGRAATTPTAIFAYGDRLGLLLASQVSHLAMSPNVPANTSGANLNRGEMRVDVNGDFWYQHTNGVGNAQKIAGPAVAGAIHAVSPTRVYDSRPIGPIAANATRNVVIPATVIPAGTKAIICTLTITNTTGSSGYLGVFPGGTTYQSTSSINWFGAGQNLATTVFSGVGPDGSINVFAGENATDFLIDVTGYCR
jgi:hypothetical protein